jgi:glycosyltransferase involved in cell wall biosynthesis
MGESAGESARVPLTVIIPTLNEAAGIRDCLASVAWAEEVIVADGGSEDATAERARQAGARVLEVRGGWIADQRNAAIAAARHEWILALDADERPEAGLAGELSALLRAPDAGAYRIRRRNFHQGEELTKGTWSRDWVARLFRHDRRYIRSRVHERLHPGPAEGTLRHCLLHTPYLDLAHHLEKIHRYAAWAAQDLLDRGATPSYGALAIRPVGRFLRSYLLDGGWRRGKRGVVEAGIGAYGVFLKYAFLVEFGRAGAPGDGDG